MDGVTFFYYDTSQKLHLHHSPKSHGQCDFIFHFHTPLFNNHTTYNYTREIRRVIK